MYQDRYKEYASPKKKQLIQNYREPNKDYQSKHPISPKKKHASPQYVRKSYFDEDASQENNYAQLEQRQYNLNCEKDTKLSALIYEAISSADQVVKQILNYQLPQLEGMCSKYLLNKQKLYSYLHSQNIGLQTHKSKNSKLSKFKPKKQDQPKEKEQVSLKQLKRLENIVCNKIIPLLNQEVQKERKKQKYSKFKYQIQVTNPEQREGINLLQKLHSKRKKFDFDDYIEVLEKYILKVMDKETKLLTKVNILQQKWEEQINKVQQYQNFIKKRQEEKHQDDIQRANQLKRMVRIEEFVKNIQSILKQQEEDYFTKQTQNLDSLAQRIRKLLKEENNKREKKCIHRQKSSSQHNEQEYSHSQNLKLKKEVIRNLNIQIGNLKQLCQQFQNKLQENNEEIIKAQLKERKLMRQNQSLCLTIQKLTEDLSRANKMVQQYLLVVGKIDQDLKLNQENINLLRQEKQRQEDQKKNLQEKNQQLVKYLEEVEERYRQLQELGEKKDKDYQQLVQSIYSKQVQIKELNLTMQSYQKQFKMMNNFLKQKQEMILQLQQKVKNISRYAKKMEVNQIQENTENTHPIAVVIDDLFIDKSEPNHERQDFVPIHRYKDLSQLNQTQMNHLNLKQINPKLLSQLSSQKENDLEQTQKNNATVGNKSQINGLQSQRIKKLEHYFIRIENEEQIKSQPEKSNVDKKQRNPQMIEQDLIEVQSGSQNLQYVYYEELLNKIKKLSQKIILLRKYVSSRNSLEEINLIGKEILKIKTILQKFVTKTTQKLKKLPTIQAQNKLAMEQIQYLRSKLQSVNMKNTFVSNIPSQSQGSLFSLDGQLRDLLKQKTPLIIFNNGKYLEQGHKKKKNQIGIQTQSFLYAQNFVQSEVIRYLPEIKRILSKEEVNQTINQSFIQQLELLNSNRFHHSLKLQTVQPTFNQETGILNASSPEKTNKQQLQQQKQDLQKMRKVRNNMLQNSVEDLGNLMNYYKEKYLNLYKLFKKTSIKKMASYDAPQTPNRKPLLQNQEYVQKLIKAPMKHQSDILSQDQKVVQKLQQKLNQSLTNKQNVYELIVLQKQEENLKLKQIIEKLSLKQNEKLQTLQTFQKIKHELLQKNKILRKKLAQMMTQNTQLNREMAFLQTRKKRDKIQKNEANQEIVDFNERADLLHNVQSSKQYKTFKLQSYEDNLSEVVQQKVQKPKKQSVSEQTINKQKGGSSSPADFSWKDLIPQHFGVKDCRK